jgi:hypothetical protein
MTRTLRALTALVLGSALAVAACSSDAATGETPAADAGATPVADTGTTPATDSGAAPTVDAGTSKPQWTLRLTVPRDYSGTPRQLAIVLVNSLPVTGIPAAFLKFVDNPTVAAGQEITLTGDVPANRGSFKVLAALYMQGGGQFTPTPGTDYDAATANFFDITGASVDFGTLPLALHTATDGH